MILKAHLSHINNLLEVTKACAEHMENAGIFQWNSTYPNRAAFENDVNRGELYIYIHNNKVVGSIVISTFMDGEYQAVKWLTQTTNHYYIHRLAVHPEFQGKGIARKMMDFAENMARQNKVASIRLDTFSKNLRNQKFYETRGYKKLGNIYFPKQSDFPFYCYEYVL